jgi:hypothetical protein
MLKVQNFFFEERKIQIKAIPKESSRARTRQFNMTFSFMLLKINVSQNLLS